MGTRDVQETYCSELHRLIARKCRRSGVHTKKAADSVHLVVVCVSVNDYVGPCFGKNFVALSQDKIVISPSGCRKFMHHTYMNVVEFD